MASPHSQFAFLRWALIVVAVLLLVAALIDWRPRKWTLWEGSRVSWADGELVYAHGPNVARTIGSGEAWKGAKPELNWTLSWFYAGKDLVLRCALIVPAVLVGTLAAWLWLRHFTARQRHRAFDRKVRLKHTRWALSALGLLVLMTALGSMFFRIDFTGTRSTFSIVDGRVSTSWHSRPLSIYRDWSFETIGTPRLFQSSWWDPSRAVLFYVHAETKGTDTVVLSLWFLATIAALPTGVLWFLRYRRYTELQCHDCGYSLVGLAPDVPCPECGTQRAIVVN